MRNSSQNKDQERNRVNAWNNTQSINDIVNPTGSQLIITDTTTFAELLNNLASVQRAEKTPTPKKLREEAGLPIATEERIEVYANGYAVYSNDYARTVVWLPSCVSFTYYCSLLKDTEKGYGISEYDALPEDLLEMLAWPIPVTMLAEHRIEANMMNRTGSRKGTKDYCSDGRYGEDPETAYLRKEGLQEALNSMTEKQREVFCLYYRDGYKQQEIADMLGIKRTSVEYRLDGAVKKMKKSIV